jgi:hypothetical protein
MAMRLLLTLLALLTGLAAQIGPAQARVGTGVDTEIGEVARSGAIQRRCTTKTLVCPPLQRQAWHLRAAMGFDRAEPAPPVPAVLQGIDRARE